MQPKILADQGKGPEITPENGEQEEQYDDILDEKDKLDKASALLPKMAKVIR